MRRWETPSKLEANVSSAAVWETAYRDAGARPMWNAEIRRASLDGPLALGARAHVVFRTGLRLRFRVVEFEDGRLFTDEARLLGARMGHRHLVDQGANGGCRLTNTIYIDGGHPRRCGGGFWVQPPPRRCLRHSTRSLQWWADQASEVS
jgi:hypothetical protein